MRKLTKLFFVILLVFSWLLFSWPPIWLNPRIPPKVSRVSAETTGPNYAGTAADGGGGNSWSNTSNATGDTTSTSATNSLSAGQTRTTNNLVLTNFGFSSTNIPDGSNIDGVTVEVEWDSGSSTTDNTVQLTKDGSTGTGDDKSTGNTQTTKSIRTYGGSTDGWNASLTQTDVTSANFGVILNYVKDGGPSETTSIYRVRVTIDYTEAPAVAISITTDGIVEFGNQPLDSTIDTTENGVNDVQTISVDAGPADLDIKSDDFSDGTNTWTLSTSNGDEQVKWEFSQFDNDPEAWEAFVVADESYTFDTNVGEGATRDLYFRLTLPTNTTSYNQYSTTVTIIASAP